MRTLFAGITITMVWAAAASAQEVPTTIGDPTQAFFFPASQVAATIAKLPDVAYANITVLERADGDKLGYRLAVDRRRPPQRGAAHATEAEVWYILDGNGEITTGGRIVETRKDEKTVDRHIVGGTVHKVTKGDFLMIPEGVPHEVTGFSPELMMVTFEFPRPAAPRR